MKFLQIPPCSMGCDTISYSAVYLGFEIESGEVVDFGNRKCDEKIDPDFLCDVSEKLQKKFTSFLNKKFGDSVPEGFLKMGFILDYSELLAEYEVSPCDFPKLVFGYNLENSMKKLKNLNSISEIDFPRSFPKNCLNILAEFLAEYKLKQGRKNKIAKISESSDTEESDGSEVSDDSESEESSDEALPKSEVKKLKENLSKIISFGLHGFVQ